MSTQNLITRIGVTLAIIVLLFQIRDMLEVQPTPPGSDAAAYLKAAIALRDGQNPYDQPIQTEVRPGETFPSLPYLYPPLLAILSIPLTYLPLQTGTFVYMLLALIEAAALSWALSRWIGWPVALAMIFLYLQTWITVYFGQIGFILGLLQFWALSAIQNGQAGALGVALSLGGLLKITPGIGFLILWRGRLP